MRCGPSRFRLAFREEQTAIHRHLLHETPRLYYAHVRGHDYPLKVADAIRGAVALTTARPPAATAPNVAGIELDAAALVTALDYSERVNGDVHQLSVPRAEAIHDGDFVIPPSIGLGTAIEFQPTGGGEAAITGDFVIVAAT